MLGQPVGHRLGLRPARAPTGGSRAAGRRGSSPGCAPRRAASRARWSFSTRPAPACSASAGGRGARRGGQGGGDAVEGVVVERGRDEPGLVGAGRRVHARVEQPVEERREAPRLGGPGRGEVGHRLVAEEHADTCCPPAESGAPHPHRSTRRRAAPPAGRRWRPVRRRRRRRRRAAWPARRPWPPGYPTACPPGTPARAGPAGPSPRRGRRTPRRAVRRSSPCRR